MSSRLPTPAWGPSAPAGEREAGGAGRWAAGARRDGRRAAGASPPVRPGVPACEGARAGPAGRARAPASAAHVGPLGRWRRQRRQGLWSARGLQRQAALQAGEVGAPGRLRVPRAVADTRGRRVLGVFPAPLPERLGRAGARATGASAGRTARSRRTGRWHSRVNRRLVSARARPP